MFPGTARLGCHRFSPTAEEIDMLGDEMGGESGGFFDFLRGAADAEGERADAPLTDPVAESLGDILEVTVPATDNSQYLQFVDELDTVTFIARAADQVGDKFRFGAEARMSDKDPDEWDCSELIQWSAHQAGVKFPDGSWNQFRALDRAGTTSSVEEALNTPGALVFRFGSDPLTTDGRPPRSHVAISLGDGRVLEATTGGVRIVERTEGWTHAGAIPGLEVDPETSPIFGDRPAGPVNPQPEDTPPTDVPPGEAGAATEAEPTADDSTATEGDGDEPAEPPDVAQRAITSRYSVDGIPPGYTAPQDLLLNEDDVASVADALSSGRTIRLSPGAKTHAEGEPSGPPISSGAEAFVEQNMGEFQLMLKSGLDVSVRPDGSYQAFGNGIKVFGGPGANPLENRSGLIDAALQSGDEVTIRPDGALEIRDYLDARETSKATHSQFQQLEDSGELARRLAAGEQITVGANGVEFSTPPDLQPAIEIETPNDDPIIDDGDIIIDTEPGGIGDPEFDDDQDGAPADPAEEKDTGATNDPTEAAIPSNQGPEVSIPPEPTPRPPVPPVDVEPPVPLVPETDPPVTPSDVEPPVPPKPTEGSADPQAPSQAMVYMQRSAEYQQIEVLVSRRADAAQAVATDLAKDVTELEGRRDTAKARFSEAIADKHRAEDRLQEITKELEAIPDGNSTALRAVLTTEAEQLRAMAGEANEIAMTAQKESDDLQDEVVEVGQSIRQHEIVATRARGVSEAYERRSIDLAVEARRLAASDQPVSPEQRAEYARETEAHEQLVERMYDRLANERDTAALREEGRSADLRTRAAAEQEEAQGHSKTVDALRNAATEHETQARELDASALVARGEGRDADADALERNAQAERGHAELRRASADVNQRAASNAMERSADLAARAERLDARAQHMRRAADHIRENVEANDEIALQSSLASSGVDTPGWQETQEDSPDVGLPGLSADDDVAGDLGVDIGSPDIDPIVPVIPDDPADGDSDGDLFDESFDGDDGSQPDPLDGGATDVTVDPAMSDLAPTLDEPLVSAEDAIEDPVPEPEPEPEPGFDGG